MAGRAVSWACSAALAAVALGIVLGGAGPVEGEARPLKLKRIGGFESPVYVDDAPGAPKLLFVVEQRGEIRLLRSGKELERPFLDLRSRVRYGGEQGLLSVAFDPSYERNRRFFVYYVNKDGNVEVDGLRHKRRDPTRADAGSRRKLIEVPHPRFANHNGGQLQFGPDRLLYIGTGDGGGSGDPGENAQDAGSLLGKLLRVDPRPGGGYSTPRSNPFAGADGRDEIYALGLRNPFRFSFDSRSGDIFIGDVGEDAWEEIDRVERGALAGANFGWDIFEGTHDFEGGGAPNGYRPPVLEYSSSGRDCSVTGGYVVHDPRIPALAGRYLYADFCGGRIRSFDPSNPGPSDSATGLEPGSPSSFGEGAHRRIYVASLEGPVYRIVQR